LSYLKKENLNLKTKLNIQENELNQKDKEINEINQLIIKYDLNTKIKNGRKFELCLEETKNKFNSQESSYILTIYQLEEEIKHLTKLLKHNQKQLKEKDDMKDKFRQLKNEVGDKLVEQKKVIKEKNINAQFLSQRISELNSKISELENEIITLEESKEREKQKNIYYHAQIKNLNNIIDENNETIESLKAEIDNLKNINKKDEEKDKDICKTILLAPHNI
jgi:chromosome segregation ATPase